MFVIYASLLVSMFAVFALRGVYFALLEENRVPTLRVVVRCPVRTISDLGALGYLVGQAANNDVPTFVGLEMAQGVSGLKALGAAMAASGSVALYHVDGLTPDAVVIRYQSDQVVDGVKVRAR